MRIAALSPRWLHFNPRSPHGERHDATQPTIMQLIISTHAPRTGSDVLRRDYIGIKRTFQPTLPARGATYGANRETERSLFQPTLPARGATRGGGHRGQGQTISTHAPRTGSDRHSAGRWCRLTWNFNPRSPHGERRLLPLRRVVHPDFNPRSPHGERHLKAFRLPWPSGFQPTLPARGATHTANFSRSSSVFQPTLPARGATAETLAFATSPQISTHAPRTGSDIYSRNSATTSHNFNPRSPHGERPGFCLLFRKR